MDDERKVEREGMDIWPNKITAANAGGPGQLPVGTRWADRFAPFRHSATSATDTPSLHGYGI